MSLFRFGDQVRVMHCPEVKFVFVIEDEAENAGLLICEEDVQVSSWDLEDIRLGWSGEDE